MRDELINLRNIVVNCSPDKLNESIDSALRQAYIYGKVDAKCEELEEKVEMLMEDNEGD